jgi:hypothetical protein
VVGGVVDAGGGVEDVGAGAGAGVVDTGAGGGTVGRGSADPSSFIFTYAIMPS